MPDDVAREHDDSVRRYVDGGDARVVGTGREVIGCHRDGTPMALYLSVGEVRLRGRRAFVGILHDVRPEAELRAALSARDAEYAAVLDAMEEGFVIQRGDGEVLTSNRAAERILGMTGGEIADRTTPQRALARDPGGRERLRARGPSGARDAPHGRAGARCADGHRGARRRPRLARGHDGADPARRRAAARRALALQRRHAAAARGARAPRARAAAPRPRRERHRPRAPIDAGRVDRLRLAGGALGARLRAGGARRPPDRRAPAPGRGGAPRRAPPADRRCGRGDDARDPHAPRPRRLAMVRGDGAGDPRRHRRARGAAVGGALHREPQARGGGARREPGPLPRARRPPAGWRGLRVRPRPPLHARRGRGRVADRGRNAARGAHAGGLAAGRRRHRARLADTGARWPARRSRGPRSTTTAPTTSPWRPCSPATRSPAAWRSRWT